MKERRSYSVVDSPAQLRIVAIVFGILLVVLGIGGAFVWYLFDSINQLHTATGIPTDAWLAGMYYRGYVVLFSVLLVVFVGLFLVIRATHRIVGPLYRLRRELRRMREEKDLELLTIRDPDHIHDFVRELNRLLKESSVDRNDEPDDADRE